MEDVGWIKEVWGQGVRCDVGLGLEAMALRGGEAGEILTAEGWVGGMCPWGLAW